MGSWVRGRWSSALALDIRSDCGVFLSVEEKNNEIEQLKLVKITAKQQPEVQYQLKIIKMEAQVQNKQLQKQNEVIAAIDIVKGIGEMMGT